MYYAETFKFIKFFIRESQTQKIMFRKVCDYCESLIKGCAGTAAG